MNCPQPHDLLWINDRVALDVAVVPWLDHCWHPGLPLVVRRDQAADGRIPVGVRGDRRDRRAAGWIHSAAVVRRRSPEDLVEALGQAQAANAGLPPLLAACALARHRSWPWRWGITGSTGYALATGQPVLHAHSDLDVIIRAPRSINRDHVAQWVAFGAQLPCRIDTQIETPVGAFSALEWLRGGREVLVKTCLGPRLMANPWQSGA